LGEVRNGGSGPAYDVTVSGRLLADNGSIAGASSESIYYLSPGQSVGFKLSVKNPSAFVRGDATVSGKSSSYSTYGQLAITGNSLRTEHNKYSGDVVRLSGLVTNAHNEALIYNHIYVWFVDTSGTVLWADDTYARPDTLTPGMTYAFDMGTVASSYNQRVPAIAEGRAYSFGTGS
jgi:hypothetical protein